MLVIFESERLRLRKLSEDDISVLHKWNNDFEVMHFSNFNIDTSTLQETGSRIKSKLESTTSKSYVIEDKVTEKPIGTIGLVLINNNHRNAMLGIEIGEKDYWSKGYGREAIRLLLDYVFLEMNLHRVYLGVFSFNERAIKLYEKLGFQHEGKSREGIFRNGKWHDVINMGILQKEYLNSLSNVTDK